MGGSGDGDHWRAPSLSPLGAGRAELLLQEATGTTGTTGTKCYSHFFVTWS